MIRWAKCSTKDTVIGLAAMFGAIAFFVFCAVQGWNPAHAAMALLLAPLALMGPGVVDLRDAVRAARVSRPRADTGQPKARDA